MSFEKPFGSGGVESKPEGAPRSSGTKDLDDDELDPKIKRQEEFKERVIPNIPQELLIVNEESALIDGTEFEQETIELAKLVQELNMHFYGEAGSGIPVVPETERITKEESSEKIERMKKLLHEKIEKDTKFLNALEDLYQTE